ncbi:LOW QUALITY PROTEIN: hypothetical protein PHMEG_00021379 [Phytophthora megakarya]|uniref:Uncharacterized protein n=1 Tax=Phytophthora megakarya TaxID=4795 RepID=A0A225VMM9_9STRA|nr:LOW QUALITY PROTEIN: hypothetical protein PHMEG_00021379 [Phytophthora megakarya]
MSPIGTPSAATSAGFEDYSKAGGADDPDAEHETCRNTHLEQPDDLHFDPSDQETMEQQNQLQLISQLQSELVEMMKQLAVPAPVAPSMSDTSKEQHHHRPRNPKLRMAAARTSTETRFTPGAGFENCIHEFEHVIRRYELVNGSTWSNDIKESGKSSRYYHKKKSEWQRSHENESMPYSAVKRAMSAEFGCKLGQLELSTKM